MTSFAFTGPGERLKAGWWVNRRITSRPVSGLVYGGVLGGFVMTCVLFVAILSDGFSVLKAGWLAFWVFLELLLVRKVREQYLSGKRRSTRGDDDDTTT